MVRTSLVHLANWCTGMAPRVLIRAHWIYTITWCQRVVSSRTMKHVTDMCYGMLHGLDLCVELSSEA
jgi:hypothetical protein